MGQWERVATDDNGRFACCRVEDVLRVASATCGSLREPRELFAAAVSAPQSAADHFDPLTDVGGGPGDDLDQAGSFGRGTVQHDVSFETEQGHRNPPRALPDDRRPE